MWAQVVSAVLGIWLEVAPAVLGYTGTAADNDHVVGPVAATFAIVACWEATRPARWANLLLGAWLIAAPWVLGYAPAPAIVNSMAVGVLLMGLSTVRGKVTGRYGGGWSSLFRSDPMHEKEAN